MAVTERVPVTVLTGFLGAGKTTLLNRILSESHGVRFGVIVNEFGEIGVDGDLVTGADEELIEMTNGCVCCTVRGDLIRTARTLLEARDLDALVVETTGLARPGPVAQSFLLDAALSDKCVLDSITAVADARWIETRLADSAEAAEQIAVADQIVLNKTDLVAPADVDRIESRLRALNPAAPILRAERAGVPVAALLGRGGFDLARLDLPEACAEDHAHGPDCGHDHAHAHAPEGHLSGIDSVSLTEPRSMDAARLEAWLGDLLAAEGEHILRAKGIVAVAGEDRRLAIQAVHALFEGDWGRAWAADEPRASRFVFIGRHLDADALRAGFASCAA